MVKRKVVHKPDDDIEVAIRPVKKQPDNNADEDESDKKLARFTTLLKDDQALVKDIDDVSSRNICTSACSEFCEFQTKVHSR